MRWREHYANGPARAAADQQRPRRAAGPDSVCPGWPSHWACVLFLGGFAWGAVVYRPYTVPTSSMTPDDRTPATGSWPQRVDGGEVRRGRRGRLQRQAWVSDAPVVKRVVAVGGDTVSCCTDGKLTVNGKQIDETVSHRRHAWPRTRTSRP